MSEKHTPEALRLADWCDANSSGDYRPSAEAAALLRTQHALLQQARAALVKGRESLVIGPIADQHDAAIAALNQHLEPK